MNVGRNCLYAAPCLARLLLPPPQQRCFSRLFALNTPQPLEERMPAVFTPAFVRSPGTPSWRRCRRCCQVVAEWPKCFSVMVTPSRIHAFFMSAKAFRYAAETPAAYAAAARRAGGMSARFCRRPSPRADLYVHENARCHKDMIKRCRYRCRCAAFRYSPLRQH